MNKRRERILDVCLDEVLGGRTPPDLTERILRASRPASPAPEAPPVQLGRPTAPPAWSAALGATPAPPPLPGSLEPITPVIRTSGGNTPRGTGRGTSSPSSWTSLALVGLVLVCGTTLGLLGLLLSSPHRQPGAVANRARPSVGSSKPHNLTGSGAREKPRMVPRPQVARHGGPTAEPSPESNPGSSPPPAVTAADTVPPVAVGPGPERDTQAVAVSDAQIVARIGTAIEQAWAQAGVQPAEPATDAEWCRRVYLRVIGRIPTVEEVDRFVASTSEHKRVELVDELTGPSYADEFATHWATIWSNALLGRHELPANSLARRDGLVEYLRAAIVADKPFDQVAAELIVATGSNQPGAADYNPAVNFLLAHAQDGGMQAAGRVARVFLGARVQCAACHVHPSGSWSQDQMWQLAAFFRQMHAERDSSSGAGRLVNQDFRGEGRDPHEAASYFELASGQLKAAFPVFLDGTAGSHSGLVSEVDRRRELAELVQRSPRLAQTAVNRLWAHFLGFGFTQPIDDVGPHNQPSHPDLLGQLATDFANQGYHVNRLIRWIALSEPFGLSSRSQASDVADSPESGRRPLFARYYSRPMLPEELSKSLQLLVDARGQATSGNAAQARVAILQQLGRALPKDDSDDSQGIRQTIPKSLIVAQQSLSAHALDGPDGSLVTKVAENQSMSIDSKIEHLFQAALARKPTPHELQVARRLVTGSPADTLQGLKDVWWVLLNSNEFILDH